MEVGQSCALEQTEKLNIKLSSTNSIKLGNPLPEVIWFKNKRRIDITYETTYSGVIQNTLDFGPLNRNDQGMLAGTQSSSLKALLSFFMFGLIYPN